MLDDGDVFRHRFIGGHPDRVQPAVPDLFRREGSGQSASLINQCLDPCFGGRAFHDGMPGILQGAYPFHQAASHLSSQALEGSGGVPDAAVEFADDIIPVDWVLAGVRRVWVTPFYGLSPRLMKGWLVQTPRLRFASGLLGRDYWSANGYGLVAGYFRKRQSSRVELPHLLLPASSGDFSRRRHGDPCRQRNAHREGKPN